MYNIEPVTSVKVLDCGATCLKMLLSYYDIEDTLEEVSKECKIGLLGSTAGDIKRAGDKYGLDIRVLKWMLKNSCSRIARL